MAEQHLLLDRSATCLQAGLVHAVLLTLSAPAKLLCVLREWLNEAATEPREWVTGEGLNIDSDTLERSPKALVQTASAKAPTHPRGRRTCGLLTLMQSLMLVVGLRWGPCLQVERN